MPKKIEDLVQKKDEIRSSLDMLSKTVWEQEKEKLQKEISKKIDDLKKEIETFSTIDETEKWKLDELKSGVDQLTSELKKFENELKKLQEGVVADKNGDTQVSWSASQEEKWLWQKTKDFVWEQWNDVTSWEKWKEEPWKNILRAAGLWLSWYALYKWAKKLWNWAFWDNEEEEDDSEETETKSKKKKKSEKSFWDTTTGQVLKTTWTILWVWTGVYYVAHGIYTQNRWLNDLWDWERWKKLDFDSAMDCAAWAIANQENKEGMSYWMNLKYHEDTSEIEAYWIRVKIDKDKRKIDWLPVEFKKYENMISTAILIAYLRKNYAWQCKNDTPFSYSWAWKWNVDVGWSSGSETAVDWTWDGWRLVGISTAWIAWIATWIFWWLKAWAVVASVGWVLWYAAGSAYDKNNILHDHMPEIDSEYWMKNLVAYLNRMWGWQERNEWKEDITESPIKDEVRKCVKKIQNENQDMPAEWWRRAFDAVPDPDHPWRYTIKAYRREIYAEVNESEKKIKILGLSWWNPAIKADVNEWNMSSIELPLQEWLYMTALIGQLLDKYHHKGNEYPRFEYTWRSWDEIASGFWLFGDASGLFFSDDWVDTLALSRENFEKNMPTLAQDENSKKFLQFLNGINDEYNVSIWKKKE